MSLPRKTTRMRLMAIVLCLLAFGIYITFAPTRSYANLPGPSGCSCSGGGGGCSGHAECVCMYANGECTACQWVQNSANCN